VGLYCSADRAEFDTARPAAPVGWGHDTRRFVPGDVAGLSAQDVPGLSHAWTFVFPDAMRARSQPAIGYGAVFVGSQDGRVYALDLQTGCVRWAYQAAAEVRNGVVIAQVGDRPLAFFGDILAWVYALDAMTGELVWSRKADDHPSATLTATPAVHQGTLYVPVSALEVIAAADPEYQCCTFRGSILALDAATGAVRWTSYTIPDEPALVRETSLGTNVYAPSGAPIWASPVIDVRRNRLYAGTGENYSSPADGNSDAVIALDLDTGRRIWTRQMTADDAWNVACMMADNPNCPDEDGPDFDLGASLLLVDLADGQQALVGGHKQGFAFAFQLGTESELDPPSGPEPLWRTELGRGSIQGGVHFGMAMEGSTLYVPINDMNDLRNGEVLDPEAARPGVHALRATDGKLLWSHVQENLCGEARPFCDPGVSAAVTAIPGVLFAGHLDGVIRAYDGKTGEVIWRFDSAREFTGVGGRRGRGGGMSGAGPAVGDGFVVVNSGYGLYFHEPGNVLLAFKPGD
jgi:polyvinyl alcohol dehydrogenase (cytochrome)